MVNWIILALSISIAGGIVVLGIRWWRQKRREGPDRQPLPREFFDALGRGLGLEVYREMNLFGESIQILRGHFDNLFVEMEVSRGDWEPYVRISIEFPSYLNQGVSVYKDDHEALLNYLRRMQELEIDDEDFDPMFLLFARDEERLTSLLPETTRFQLLQLAEDVERLRLTDDGFFLFLCRPCSADEISRRLRKSIELADRVYHTAYVLGPSRSSAEASRYQQEPLEGIREAAGIEDAGELEEKPREDAR